MRVPDSLSTGFGDPFEELLSSFAVENGLLPEPADIRSPRFLARSVLPHITKLSALFNREDADQGEGLSAYWKSSSNPTNLRLAYFLYFMPCNLFRMASVWAELSRLGYRWPAHRPLKALELGAGPASGACGIAAGERYASVGLPREGSFALIEQDKAMLDLGAKWATRFAAFGGADWSIRPFHRKLDLKQGLLPPAAPKFNLWISSFFLNELSEDPAAQAQALLQVWEKHLEEEGLVILVEPALRLQSRKLLELRKALLAAKGARGTRMQVLLPCLGHQNCGALADAEDWCHEEVNWWRPMYMRQIDKMAELDRKNLPFSYLVLTKSSRSRAEILPKLADANADTTYRLVSPAHMEGKEQEFFLCGQEGKCRARYRAHGSDDSCAELGRGDVLIGAEIRGDVHCSRVERIAAKV